MSKREEYITLELSGDSLESFVTDLRDKLLSEFWPNISDENERNLISARLEKSILGAFKSQSAEIQAT